MVGAVLLCRRAINSVVVRPFSFAYHKNKGTNDHRLPVLVLLALWTGSREGVAEKQNAIKTQEIQGLDYDCGHSYMANCDEEPIRTTGACIQKCKSKGFLWSMIDRCYYRCVIPKMKNDAQCKEKGGHWAAGPQACLAWL